MSEDEVLELYNVFKELHERVESLEKLIISKPLLSYVELRVLAGNLEFDLRAQADKYLELYQKF